LVSAALSVKLPVGAGEDFLGPQPYCLAQTITAFAPPSQLAPVVPSMCRAFPPAQ
jgi:hypothetical protein